MKKRISFYFFLFILFFCIRAVGKEHAVPPVIVKLSKNANYSLSSSPVTLITREQINSTGTTTLEETLEDLGVVQLQDLVGNGSQVALSMRGFGTNATSNTLLLINGIPITNPDLMPPDLNVIPIHQIKAVEIIAGSESVLYGDQAVGGIVNVITQDQVKEKANLSCSTGSYHQHECYAALYSLHHPLTTYIAVAKQHDDNYREHNAYNKALLTGNMDYHYSTGNLRFDYTLANEKMQYPGALTLEQVHQNRRQAANTTDFFKDQTSFFQLHHQQTWISNWETETDIASRMMNGDGVLFSPFNQSRKTFFFKPQLKGTWEKLFITSGVDLQNDQYHFSSLYGTTNDHQQKYGIFTLFNVPAATHLLFSLGMRGALQESRLETDTINNNLNRAFASTVGATYQWRPNISFYLRRAESFRFPKADENAFTAPGLNGLQTQRGIAYETGMQTQGDTYSTNLGVFQLYLKDEISFDPTSTPLQPFGTNRNLDPTSRSGFTFSAKKHITDKLMVDGQYNFVNARFQSGINKGKRIPLVSENILRAGANYLLTEHWNIYSEAIYTGNYYGANDDANVTGKNGGRTIYNFNLHYTYRQFSASLRMNNIFNKYYYYYTVYQANQEYFYPAPGRNFSLTLNYSFA